MKRMIPWNKGKKGVQIVSLETRKKLSEINKANPNKPWLGKKLSLEHRKKLSEAVRGEKHRLWKGGLKVKQRGFEYNLWRARVFQRNNWTCQTCRVRGCYLQAHHIKSWAYYPKMRYMIENGITLCEHCHSLTNNYKGKNYAFRSNQSPKENNGSQPENPSDTRWNRSK